MCDPASKRQPSAQPLTARTRAQVDALQVSSETSSEGRAGVERGCYNEPPCLEIPLPNVESRVSYGQGDLVVSEDELSYHLLSVAVEENMPTRDSQAKDRDRTAGNSLLSELRSDMSLMCGERSGQRADLIEPIHHAEEVEEAKEEVKAPYGWPALSEFPKWYLRRLIGFDQSLDVYGFYPTLDLIVVFVFTALTLVVLGLIEHYGFRKFANGSISAFIPAFGASCTVVYGVPKAPIAQPRNAVIAHVTAAIIGRALTNAFRNVGEQPFGQHCAGAIGVGLHLALMMVTNTMHPPASATVISAATSPINAYYKDEGFLFCVAPVLFGSLVVCIMAWLLNNIFLYRGPYPQYW